MTKQDGGAAFPGKKRFRAEDVPGLTDDELVSVGLDLLGDMARIRQDLEIAKSDAAQGVYSDPVWFRSATAALRHMGRTHQAILAEQGKRKRKEIKWRSEAFPQMFVDIARKELPPEQFAEIYQQASMLAEREKGAQG